MQSGIYFLTFVQRSQDCSCCCVNGPCTAVIRINSLSWRMKAFKTQSAIRTYCKPICSPSLNRIISCKCIETKCRQVRSHSFIL